MLWFVARYLYRRIFYTAIDQIIFGILNINKYFCLYEKYWKLYSIRSKNLPWSTNLQRHKNFSESYFRVLEDGYSWDKIVKECDGKINREAIREAIHLAALSFVNHHHEPAG